MSDVAFGDIPIVNRDEYPVTQSVKIRGPPGTGKSTQSFRRAVEYTRERDIEVDDIGVVTYRRALAADLLQTLEAETDVVEEYDLEDPYGRTQNIGTVHAICKRMMEDNPSFVYDSHKERFCDEVNMEYDGADSSGELFFRVLQWTVNNEHSVDEAYLCPFFDDFERAHRHGTFESLAEEWGAFKRRHDLYEFSDLLSIAKHQGLTPDVDLLIIDELHDVYPLMFSVIQQWISDVQESGGTVIVAGDTHQVINSHEGASPEFFQMVELPEVFLDKSWRVPQTHWELATSVLSQSHTPPGVEPTEDDGQVETLNASVTNHGSNRPQDLLEEYSGEDDVMYLARIRAQCQDIAKCLRDAGIVYNSSSGIDAWDRDINPQRVAIYNILQIVSQFDASDFESHGWKQGLIADNDDIEDIEVLANDLARFTEVLPEMYISGGKDDLLMELQEADNWMLERYVHWTTDDFWHCFHRALNGLNCLDVGDDLRDTVDAALRRNDEPIEDADDIDVVVRTIHASKGSEAETVIVYDGISRRIRTSIQDSPEAERNEDRVWYVALTRASQNLVIAQNAWRYTTPYLREALRAGDVL